MRQHYIDNLRSICILLLLPYHAAMAWNVWDEAFYVSFEGDKVMSSFVTMISPWYMALLFVLAGMSARYALQRRSNKQFVLERVKKLIIPFAAGELVVVPFMAYLADMWHNGYCDGFFMHFKVFFTRYTDLTGSDGGFTIGHLWFLLYLFAVALLGLLIRAIDKRFISHDGADRPREYRVFQMILVGTIPLLFREVLSVGGKSVIFYLLLYLTGYYIFAHKSNVEKLAKRWYVYLVIFLAADAGCTYMYIWMDDADGIIISALHVVAIWFGILAMLAVGKRFLNRTNRVWAYIKERSFMIYIVHFVWVLLLLYVLGDAIKQSVATFILTSIGATIMTLLTCELLRMVSGKRKSKIYLVK